MQFRRWTSLALSVIATAALVYVTSAGTFSSAAFTTQKSNPSNSFEAQPYFGFFHSGAYVGNGADNRAITGAGFQPDFVIVKGNTAQTAVARTSTMQGDLTKPLSGATALTADMIQSLEGDGFTVGTNARVNSPGVTYEWMAFRAQEGLLDVGSYIGNGSSQAVGGIGFSPDYGGVFSSGEHAAVQAFAGGTSSFQFDADTGNTTRITAQNADGFSVGSHNTVNSNGTTYHYVAFNDAAGIVDVNGYTGNNSDNRSLTGVGFQPEYVMIRANDTSTARQGAHRSATLPGDSSLRYNAAANFANGIQALQSDGFQLGTDATVNAGSIAYRYLAVRDTPGSAGGGCTGSGSQLVPAIADSYVVQDSPGSTAGTASTLMVQAKSGNANRRTLIRFNLPSIPSGCTLTGATLKLHSTAATTGRTIDVYQAAATPAWTETGVTWPTAPAPAGPASSRAAATGALTWDVTAQTQAMYSGTNNGYIFRDATEDSTTTSSQTFQSREGSTNTQDPELRVTWG